MGARPLTCVVVAITKAERVGITFSFPGVRFCLMVKKGYRDPPYHNWMHAFSVSHFCYLLYKNLGLSRYLQYVNLPPSVCTSSSLSFAFLFP